MPPAPRGISTRKGAAEASLPSAELLELQARWLAPARAQLLRRVHIAHRRRTLDLGTGTGSVLPELARRSAQTDSMVLGLDRSRQALRGISTEGVRRVAGDGVHLPLADGTLDLIFSQMALLWITPLDAAVAEIWRVLEPGGALVTLEPDYGGLIEYPETIGTRDLWLAALGRAGADPYVGRKLPSALEDAGFDVRVSLFNSLRAADAGRFRFLEELPLTEEETVRHSETERSAQLLAGTGPWSQIAHLPFFLIRALKPMARLGAEGHSSVDCGEPC